jgi:hypothetical protein
VGREYIKVCKFLQISIAILYISPRFNNTLEVSGFEGQQPLQSNRFSQGQNNLKVVAPKTFFTTHVYGGGLPSLLLLVAFIAFIECGSGQY